MGSGAITFFHLCISENPYLSLCIDFCRKIKVLKNNELNICLFIMRNIKMHNEHLFAFIGLLM